MNRFALQSCVFVCILIALSPGLILADNAYAKRTMAELEEHVTKEGWERAEIQIETVKEALKDADAATAGPIKKRLAEIEKLTTTGVKKVKTERIIGKIANSLKTAKEYINEKRSCEEELERAKQEIESEDNAPFLDAATKKSYLSEIAVIRKQMLAKNMTQAIEALKKEVEQAEKAWPEAEKTMQAAKESPEGARGAATEMSHALDAVVRAAEGLPTDDPQVQKLMARHQKLKTAFDAVAGAGEASEAYDSLKRYWDDQAAESAGWEQETTGPKFSELISQQSEAMSSVGAPKTVKLISNADQWLKNRADDENFKTLVKDAKIKALYDQVTSQRAKAWSKIEGFADAIVTEAEAATLNKDSRDRLERFAEDDLRLAIEGSPKQVALKERALKKVKVFDDGAASSSQAQEKLYQELTAKAAKAWPDMVAKFKIEDFNANAAMKDIGKYKGKCIRFPNVSNRMGWDYRPGKYEFAVEADGQHVVGKYSPLVKTTVDDVTARTGKDFSNDEYDVIAKVVGTGPVVKITRSEGKIKFQDGDSADVTAQKDETVDGIHLEVVGLYVGPVAVAEGQGAVDESGKIAIPAGVPAKGSSPTSTSFLSVWISRLLLLVIGLGGALVVLLQSGFAPVASMPQLATVKQKLTPQIVTIIGFTLMIYGAYHLIFGWIIYGLLINLALIAAGAYLTLDKLEALKVIKPEHSALVRPYGSEIGLALAGVIVLNLLLGLVGFSLMIV
jgi:hypothetical protein